MDLKKGRGEAATLALPKHWAMDQCNPLPKARSPSLACEGAKLGCRADPRSAYTGAPHEDRDWRSLAGHAAADGLYSALTSHQRPCDGRPMMLELRLSVWLRFLP